MPNFLANTNPPVRPQVTSYDCGYEYSVEYWTFLRRLIEEEDTEVQITEEVEEAEVLVSSAAG